MPVLPLERFRLQERAFKYCPSKENGRIVQDLSQGSMMLTNRKFGIWPERDFGTIKARKECGVTRTGVMHQLRRVTTTLTGVHLRRG